MLLECIPSVYWWVLAHRSKLLIIESNFSFQKQTALSQYSILGGNGAIQLSVPTKKKSRKGLFEKVEISNDEKWQIAHWKSIESAYQKAPFFIYYNYKIEPVFTRSYTYLADFNLAMIKVVLECIKSPIELELGKGAHLYNELSKEQLPVYPQVFDSKLGFNGDVSILDLLFNLGPESLDYLTSQAS